MSTYALPVNGGAQHVHAHSHSHGHSHGHDSTGSQAAFTLAPFANVRPKPRPRGESDLGRPVSRKSAAATFGFTPIQEAPVALAPVSWLELPEALAALLIPLPYVFASLAYPCRNVAAADLENPLNPLGLELELPLQLPLPSASQSQLLHACALSAATLLAIGAVAQIRSHSHQPLDRRKSVGGAEGAGSAWNVASLARVSRGSLGVVLPFYAALQLGGARTALCLLVAVAAGLGSFDQRPGKHSLWDGVKRTLRTRKATNAALLTAMAVDVMYSENRRHTILGQLALAMSILAAPPPLPTAGWSLMTGRGANINSGRLSLPKPTSPLTSTAGDTLLTLVAGTALGVATSVCSFFSSSPPSVSPYAFVFSILCVSSAAAQSFFTRPSALRAPKKIGLGMGCLLVSALGMFESQESWARIFFPLTSALLYTTVYWSTKSRPHSHDHAHNHKRSHSHDHHLHGNHSRLSEFVIGRCTPGSILHSVLIEKDSRRIAYFGVLNLSFMMVQFFYGYVSGSLGLLTDSIHMLFDCAGLAVGLAAAVMSKWSPNARFPYGYGKIDTLSGFANGVFLMLVSLEIIFDASERLWEGHELQRLNELLIVSILGFLVNIVGLTAFGHAHHGHGHEHSHGGEGEGDSHGHHHHDSENMQGIFLHILADALGSVAVIVSTLLTMYYGWSGWDPIASCMIAILIFGSAIPLVKSSGMRLLLSLPADAEYGIRNSLQEVSSLRGVVGYTVPRFWLEDEGAAHSEVHAKEGGCGGHGHDHSDGHRHGDEKGHSHSESDSNGHGHSHSHGGHEHTHETPKPVLALHSHDHSDHNQGHAHTHSHSHDNHSHPPDHTHDHSAHAHPEPRGRKVLGVIHIIASRVADLEDVRERTVQFLKGRGMDVVVHVEREGEGRCWCGGGVKTG